MLTPLETELLKALKEVIRISDRKHIAWDAAKEAIAKAESVARAGATPSAWAGVLPDGWEIRSRAEMIDGDGEVKAWARFKWYVLDGRTDVRGEGDTIRAAIEDAGLKLDALPLPDGNGGKGGESDG